MAPSNQSEAMRGSVELLALKTLSLEPMHGWGISQRVQEMSGGYLDMNQGTLYPALQRLEGRGLIASEWGRTENGRKARFYRLTASGAAALQEEENGWRRFVAAMELVLRTT